MCKTFKTRECGHSVDYSLIILCVLLPILLLRSLGAIGYFSIVVLIFTFFAIGVIIYMCADIYTKSPSEIDDEYHVHVTDEDRNYNYFDGGMIPVFCATMMTLFEGNQ
jgi:hypothetical protein